MKKKFRLSVVVKLLVPVVLILTINFGLRFLHQQGIEKSLQQLIGMMAANGMNLSCDQIKTDGIFGSKLKSEINNCEVYLGTIGLNGRLYLPKVVLRTDLFADKAIIELPEQTEIAMISNQDQNSVFGNIIDSFLVQLQLQNDRVINVLFREKLMLGVVNGFDDILSRITFNFKDSAINANQLEIISLEEVDGDISFAEMIDLKLLALNRQQLVGEEKMQQNISQDGNNTKGEITPALALNNGAKIDLATKISPIHTKISVKNVKIDRPQFFGKYAEYFAKIDKGNIVVDVEKNIENQKLFNNDNPTIDQAKNPWLVYRISNSGFQSGLFNLSCDGTIRASLLDTNQDIQQTNQKQNEEKLSLKFNIGNYDILIQEIVRALYGFNNANADKSQIQSNIALSKFVFRSMFADDLINANLHLIQKVSGEWRVNGYNGDELNKKLGGVLALFNQQKK